MVECVADEEKRRKGKRGSSKRMKRNGRTVRRERMIMEIKLVSEEKKVKENEQVEPISSILLVVCKANAPTNISP